ncbi:MAG TPA: hypothetical protein VHY09_15775 [Candidatus Methylacidiphilales bacterium]|jgi:hypothetical protein|nr:hypothetical protein [Candidatus Methylacidiphilales bacterium]
MGKFLSIALFVLLVEIRQVYLYLFAAHDLARVGLIGPLAGALAGVGVATLLEQLCWPRLDAFRRCILYVAIAVCFISAGTAYYQCYAEQITYDARLLHLQTGYAAGAWGGNPWLMYQPLAGHGYGVGLKGLPAALGQSLTDTLAASIVWLPLVMLIAWLTTRPGRPMRNGQAPEVVPV